MFTLDSELGSRLKRNIRFRGLTQATLERPRPIPRNILLRNRLWKQNIGLEAPETTISAAPSENEKCSTRTNLNVLNSCEVTHKIWWSNFDAEAFEFVYSAKGKSPKEKLDIVNPRGGARKFWWINVDVFGILKADIQKSAKALNPFGGTRKIYWSNIDLVLLHKLFNPGQTKLNSTNNGKLQNLIKNVHGRPFWCNQDLGLLKKIACNENALQIVGDVVDSKISDDQFKNEMDENSAEYWTAYWKYWQQ